MIINVELPHVMGMRKITDEARKEPERKVTVQELPFNLAYWRVAVVTRMYEAAMNRNTEVEVEIPAFLVGKIARELSRQGYYACVTVLPADGGPRCPMDSIKVCWDYCCTRGAFLRVGGKEWTLDELDLVYDGNGKFYYERLFFTPERLETFMSGPGCPAGFHLPTIEEWDELNRLMGAWPARSTLGLGYKGYRTPSTGYDANSQFKESYFWADGPGDGEGKRAAAVFGKDGRFEIASINDDCECMVRLVRDLKEQ